MNNEKLILSLMKKFGCSRADAIDWAQDIHNCSSEPNGRLTNIEEITEAVTFSCECIECGWTTKTTKHCDTFKCEKCGGTMRRAERPGPGKESSQGVEEDELGEAVRLRAKAKAGIKTLREPVTDETGAMAKIKYQGGVRI